MMLAEIMHAADRIAKTLPLGVHCCINVRPLSGLRQSYDARPQAEYTAAPTTNPTTMAAFGSGTAATAASIAARSASLIRTLLIGAQRWNRCSAGEHNSVGPSSDGLADDGRFSGDAEACSASFLYRGALSCLVRFVFSPSEHVGEDRRPGRCNRR